MDKATDKVFGYIDAMAEKLGVASEHIYEVLVKQAVASGIMDIVTSIVFLSLLVVMTILLFNVYTKAKYEEDTEGYIRRYHPANKWAELKESDFFEDGFVWGVYVLALGALSLVILLFGYDGVIKLINPEYYAIKEILDTLK